MPDTKKEKEALVEKIGKMNILGFILMSFFKYLLTLT